MNKKDRRILELMLIVVTIGMTYMAYRMGTYKMVVLNLFFLPIVISGYYLGRTSAGVLALFCTLSVTLVATLDPAGFAAYQSPVMIGLAITVWASILGLTAILVGTLCDERSARVHELHEAYVGIVDVLFKYLQSANPNVKARSIRIAELCQSVAEELKLSRVQIDDIRVGALLFDLGNVEITTKMINKAINTLESSPDTYAKNTFLGVDLVNSLGSVLHGAVPLLINQGDEVQDVYAMEEEIEKPDMPLGAHIIRAVRKYDALVYDGNNNIKRPTIDVINEIKNDINDPIDDEILGALERVGQKMEDSIPKPQPSLV